MVDPTALSELRGRSAAQPSRIFSANVMILCIHIISCQLDLLTPRCVWSGLKEPNCILLQLLLSYRRPSHFWFWSAVLSSNLNITRYLLIIKSVYDTSLNVSGFGQKRWKLYSTILFTVLMMQSWETCFLCHYFETYSLTDFCETFSKISFFWRNVLHNFDKNEWSLKYV